MSKLYPRLASIEVTSLLDEYRQSGVRWSFSCEKASYGASGGAVISASEIQKLRSDMVATAEKFNYGGGSSKSDLRKFDYAAGIVLWNWIGDSPEALRDDVWSFLATVLLPDLADWRFPGLKNERFQGGIRNTFQRLWVRSRCLGREEDHDDRWGLISTLSEDALVAITERPAISADPVLAISIAEGWVRAAEKFGASSMENRMRQAVIRIRVGNLIQMIPFVNSDEREVIIDQAFGLR